VPPIPPESSRDKRFERFERFARQPKSRLSLFTLYTGKLPQKLIERIAAGEIINQVLKRNARADENRCAPESRSL
jgi:hypothetical protein